MSHGRPVIRVSRGAAAEPTPLHPDAAASGANGRVALGLARHRAGDLATAERHYRAALRVAPDDADALHMLGVVRGARGHPAEAEKLLRAAIALRPGRAEPWSNLGSLLLRFDRAADAAAALREAIARDPGLADALANLAGALLALDQPVAAEQVARRAVGEQPRHAVALANLGGALLAQGRVDEARESLEAAAAEGRHSTALLRNLGQVRLAGGDVPGAETAFRQALAHDADDLECQRGLAFALARLRRLTEAEALLEHYVARRPQPSNAHFMLGHLRVLAGRYAAGEAVLRQGALRPDAPAAEASTWLFDLNYMPAVPQPTLLAEHVAWGRRYAGGIVAESPRRSRDPDRRLTLGFVSPDLRAHAVSFFLRPLLAHIDADAFAVTAYANVATPDVVTDELRGLVAGWRDIRKSPDDAVAAAIRDDGVDLLIDLAGHTADNRLLVFARRPAPVQVSYLGYPATTGMDAMDARIVDRWTDPPGADAFATERLCRLERCFLAYAPTAYPEITPPPVAARGEVTFGSFNNLAKLNDAVVALWSRVLSAAAGSTLLLKHDASGDEGVQEHLLRAFAAHGIERRRLRFLPRTPDLVSHLAMYGEVDIALDPFPYTGTTTTCEALWMGVPVVTLTGAHHASRVGLSVLTAAGFPAGVASDPDDYVRTAVELARAPALLTALRSMLRPGMAASALCDGAGLAQAFTAALRDLWSEWCATGCIRRPAHPAAGPDRAPTGAAAA